MEPPVSASTIYDRLSLSCGVPAHFCFVSCFPLKIIEYMDTLDNYLSVRVDRITFEQRDNVIVVMVTVRESLESR